MIQEIINIRVITPDTKGNYLTQVAEPEGDRIFSEKIFLSEGDSPRNYREVTPSEREVIELEDKERELQRGIEEEKKRVALEEEEMKRLKQQ